MSLGQDKSLGCWMGMAIGDAMGAAVRGLKPATVAQLYKVIDGYKDVRPFIGKGVKQYHMQGLYGAQTQTAFVIADHLLTGRGIDRMSMMAALSELKQGGPENYFGVYRRPEANFRKALDRFDDLNQTNLPEKEFFTGAFLTAGMPVALYFQGDQDQIIKNCLALSFIFKCHFWEVVGIALVGFLIDRFIKIAPNPGEDLNGDLQNEIIDDIVSFCKSVETDLDKLHPEICRGIADSSRHGMSRLFKQIRDHAGNKELTELLTLVCESASETIHRPISHPAQGFVLTLLPMALLLTLKAGNDFSPILTAALHFGGEGDKLGALTGAFAGALFGLEQIPQNWKSGLVNSREIKLRGEALYKKKASALKSIFDMELNLTQKESEERKRFLPKEMKRKAKKTLSSATVILEEDERSVPERENPREWRKYERDKSRKKRDRRKNMPLD